MQKQAFNPVADGTLARSYLAMCEGCHSTLREEAYQAAEHLVHQLDGDGTVSCGRCGCRDWVFEVDRTLLASKPEARPGAEGP